MKYRYELNNRDLCDWKGVERRLRRMAAKGWRLDRITNYAWRYRQAPPADVHYAVTYLPDLAEDTPRPDPDERALTDLCEAAGWQKVDDWNGMLIYQNEQPDPLPLVTDEALRLANIHVAMRRRWLWGMLLLPALCALLTLLGWPLWVAAAQRDPLTVALLAALAFGYPLSALACYGLWYAAARRAVAAGRPCPANPAQSWLNNVWGVAAVAFVVVYAIHQAEDPGGTWYPLLYFCGIMALNLLIALLRRKLRERGVSRGVNIAVSLGAAFVAVLSLILVLQAFFLR